MKPLPSIVPSASSTRRQHQYKSPEDANPGGMGNSLPAFIGRTVGLVGGIGTLADAVGTAEASRAAAGLLPDAGAASLGSLIDTPTGSAERPRVRAALATA